jgi:Ca2+-binding RTX toxin-like protein
MSGVTRNTRRSTARAAVLVQLAAIASVTALSASAAAHVDTRPDGPTAPESATTSLVWREGRIVYVRGGTASSQLNFGVGLFANGIIDYNGALAAGAGCAQSDRSRVSCGPSGSWNQVRGRLGPGDDTIGTIIPMVFSGVSGGYGRDTFYGTSDADAFYGGPGNDLLQGGDGDDYLAGGPGADRIECGEGWDTADVDAYDRVSACEVRK